MFAVGRVKMVRLWRARMVIVAVAMDLGRGFSPELSQQSERFVELRSRRSGGDPGRSFRLGFVVRIDGSLARWGSHGRTIVVTVEKIGDQQCRIGDSGELFEGSTSSCCCSSLGCVHGSPRIRFPFVVVGGGVGEACNHQPRLVQRSRRIEPPWRRSWILRWIEGGFRGCILRWIERGFR
jgi:hypothetical protein